MTEITVTVRRATWVLILCTDCGRPFPLSDRAARNLRAGKRSGRCDRCREAEELVVTQEHYDFWLAQFTDAEITVMIQCSWGPPEDWTDEWRSGFRFPDPMEIAIPSLEEAAA